MNIQMQYSASIMLYIFCFLFASALAGLAQIYQRSVAPAQLSPAFTQTSRPHRLFWLLSFLVPFLLSSLRWNVGTDYATYISLYEAINNISTSSQFFSQLAQVEPLYVLMNMLVKAVFNSPLPVFFISALLLLGFVYRSLEDYHQHLSVMLAVFVFLFLMFSASLNIMRQMIAVAIVFFATRYIFRHEYKKAAVFLAIAVLFHYSALFILPFWLFRGTKRYERNIRIILFSSLILMFIFGSVFGSVFDRLRYLYLQQTVSQPDTTLRIGLLLLRAPLIVPVLIFRKRLIAHDERNYYWIILIVFELVFSYLGYILDILNRFSLYFAVSWIVLLPALVRCMPTRAAQYRMGAYVIFVSIGLWVFNTAISNFGEVLPYKSIFDANFLSML